MEMLVSLFAILVGSVGAGSCAAVIGAVSGSSGMMLWSLSDSMRMVTGTSSSMLWLVCVMVGCCCCCMSRVGSVVVCCISCSMSRTGADGVSSMLSLFMGSFCTNRSTDPRPFLGVCIKSFGELEVTIVIGLCNGESDTRLMTSTVSELFHLSRSVLTMEEYRCCLRFKF